MNSKQYPISLQKDLLLLGAVLAIIGSFLPWEVEGDFLPSWRYGIQIYPSFADNGGVVVLLLGLLIIFLVSRLEGFRQYVTKNILTCAIFLFVISAYHIIDWLVRRAIANGVIGAPAVRIGLILVEVGSVIILAAAFYLNSKLSVSHSES